MALLPTNPSIVQFGGGYRIYILMPLIHLLFNGIHQAQLPSTSRIAIGARASDLMDHVLDLRAKGKAC